MPVLSPYLEKLWNQVLAEKGWNAKQLAEASGVSYGYVRKIINGTLIPSRDALRRMCAATGQDFGAVWRGLHADQEAADANPQDETFDRAAKFFSVAKEKLFGPSEANTSDLLDAKKLTPQKVNSIEEELTDLARERVHGIMNTLPLTGVVELLQRAKEISQKHSAEPLPQ